MAAEPILVFCSGGNRRFVTIATEIGYRYGARLPSPVHPEIAPLWFADQDWRKPNRAAYMASLARWRPTMATVMDWEYPEQLNDVLSWAEEAAQFVELVQIIPKVIGGIGHLPRRIGGRDVVLGYSAPSAFGKTSVPVWEFFNWPIHILGGSPNTQMRIWRYLHGNADIVSVDGNYAQKLAQRCQVWTGTTTRHARNRYWPTLRELGQVVAEDACYEAFRQSCQNITAAWSRLDKNTSLTLTEASA